VVNDCGMKDDVLKDNSFKFASGTSVGAKSREAEHAESMNDFIHKMAIAQKEINETIYRLELLNETEYKSSKEYESIHTDSIENIKLLTSSIKTTPKKLTISHEPLATNH